MTAKMQEENLKPVLGLYHLWSIISNKPSQDSRGVRNVIAYK